MQSFSAQAILLRRIDYGDHDLIITFFSPDRGRFSAIAKSAKKSSRRFPGILEPFSVLQIVCGTGRKKGLPILKEAVSQQPFPHLREDIQKTGYAAYWSEIINEWLEEHHEQADLYHLLRYVLEALDNARNSGEALSVLFQMQFLTLSGMGPNLVRCVDCRTDLDTLRQPVYGYDVSRGGVVCERCDPAASNRRRISWATIKQLQWMQKTDVLRAARIRLTPEALEEGRMFLEAFVPYHLGKAPKSLKFLQRLRTGA